MRPSYEEEMPLKTFIQISRVELCHDAMSNCLLAVKTVHINNTATHQVSTLITMHAQPVHTCAAEQWQAQRHFRDCVCN